MGTKNNPGLYDCHAAAAPDEPMFTLLGRDPMAPSLVMLWAILRGEAGEDAEKVAEAKACADAMALWLQGVGKRPIDSLAELTAIVAERDALRRQAQSLGQQLEAMTRVLEDFVDADDAATREAILARSQDRPVQILPAQHLEVIKGRLRAFVAVCAAKRSATRGACAMRIEGDEAMTFSAAALVAQPDAFAGVSLQRKIAVLNAEYVNRRNWLPWCVANGWMTQAEADEEILVMGAILEDYRRILRQGVG